MHTLTYCDHGVPFQIEHGETYAVSATEERTKRDIVELIARDCGGCAMTEKKHCNLLMSAIDTERKE